MQTSRARVVDTSGMRITRRARDRVTTPEAPAGTAEEQEPLADEPEPVAHEPEPVADEPEPLDEDPGRSPGPRRRFSIAASTPVLLLRTAHPRQALLTAVLIAGAATLAGRSNRALGLVFLTCLVGQAILGWHNDLVDRRRDARHENPRKPLALGTLDPGTVWFTLTCAVFLLVPLSVTNGLTAGSAYLLAVAVGVLANVVLRRTWLSWLPWAVQFALYPAFLSYGGWGGDYEGNPPEIAITALAAALGLGVHVLRSLPGLVADDEDGYRSLPLRIALRTGATRLLVLASVYTAAVVVALLLTGNAIGLSQ